MKVSKKRSIIDDEKLLAPLPISDGVGDYLRYDPLYDQIREERRSEDEGLSQGVWQRDLKKADFIATEQLCANVLEFRSKDLQIAAWLTESWLALDGIDGFYRGVKILHQLNNTYWSNIYPQGDDGDFEARVRLFEWMNDQFANMLLLTPLTYHSLSQEKPVLTLSDWISALNIETVAKRSSDYLQNIANAEEKNKITLSLFRKTLQSSDARFLQKNLVFAQNASEEIKTLYEFLGQKLGKQSSSFKRVRTCLDDIIRICKTTLQQRSLPLEFLEEDSAETEVINEPLDNESYDVTEIKSPVDDDIATILSANISNTDKKKTSSLTDEVMDITGRREAYQALRDIGYFLQNLDPHSPTPSLIEMMVGWENKSLPSILEDLSNAPSNIQMLIRMLSNSLPNQHLSGRGTNS